MKQKLIIGFSLLTFLTFLWNTNCTAVIGESSANIKFLDKTDVSSQVFNYKNNKLHLNDEEIHLMAQIVYAESRAEPYEGRVAVASVILNRLLHPGFPKTIEGIIKQKGAFSCVVNGKINVVPTKDCYSAVMDALKGKDPTGEAVFFYNPKISTCKWMKSVKKSNVKPIGNHVFFMINR